MLCFFLSVLASPFKSTFRLEAENAVLRHQLNVLRCRLHGRVRLTNHDRLFFIQLYRWFPSILEVLTIVRPETLLRWHRAGFRCYWRWKSRPQGGRPQIDTELRGLIRTPARLSTISPVSLKPCSAAGFNACSQSARRGFCQSSGRAAFAKTLKQTTLIRTKRRETHIPSIVVALAVPSSITPSRQNVLRNHKTPV